MKHNIYILVIMLATIVFVSQSCKKEEATVEINNSTNQLLRAWGGGEDNTESLINKFIERMDIVRENPSYEGSNEWNYSRDSTVWYIEAALNYKYAYPNEKRSKLFLDSMFIDIDLNNESESNILELQNEYDRSLSILAETFNSIEAEHKFFVSIDYKIISTENNLLKLKAYYYFGKFSVNLPDGTWKVIGGEFGMGGLMLQPQGQGVILPNYDATNKIEQELFNNNYVHSLDVCFTNVESNTWGWNFLPYVSPLIPFNYSPCEPNYLYEEYFCSTGGCQPLYWLDYNRIDVYINNNIPIFSNYHQATSRSVFVEDIIFEIKMIQLPMDNYHLYVNCCSTGEMHPRINGPSNLLID